MKLVQVLIAAVLLMPLSVVGLAALGFTQAGPDETAAFERGLYDLLPVYQCAIRPRQEVLSMGAPAADVPKECVQAVKTSLEKVVAAAAKPSELDTREWLGLHRLRYERNFIIGAFTSADGKCKAQFQASDTYLYITFASEEILSADPHEMTTDKICGLAKTFLAIPAENAPLLKADGALANVAGTAVYHGVLRCDWAPDNKSPAKERRWWSDVPYFYTEGNMMVAVSTYPWEMGPSAYMGDTWNFTIAENMPRTMKASHSSPALLSFDWDGAPVLPGQRAVRLDEGNARRAGEECADWIERIIADGWRPDRAFLSTSQVMVANKFGSTDAARVEWETHGYRVVASQSALVIAVVMTPLSGDLGWKGKDAQKQGALELAKQIIGDVPLGKASRGGPAPTTPAPSSSKAAILDASFSRGHVRECVDGILGCPAELGRGERVANAPFGLWWRDFYWWTDGKSFGFFTFKYDGGVVEPNYEDMVERRWFGVGQ